MIINKLFSYFENSLKTMIQTWYFFIMMFVVSFWIPFKIVRANLHISFFKLNDVIPFLNIFGWFFWALFILLLISRIGEHRNPKNSVTDFLQKLTELVGFLSASCFLLTPFLSCQSPEKLLQIFLDLKFSDFGIATTFGLSVLIAIEFCLRLIGFSFGDSE